MKVEITYLPQGQHEAVTEQYETLFLDTNFYIEKKYNNKANISFYAYEKINGKYKTTLIEICSDTTIILNIIEL